MAKRKRAATTSSSSKPEASAEPIELVVRRGALWRFNTLKKETSELPVRVLWDRRQSDRRTGSSPAAKGERRGTDRRQKPPFTWDAADFLVVGQASTPEPAPKKRTQRKTKTAGKAARVSRSRKG